MQQTLILLKPDAVHRRLVGDRSLARFEAKGLRLVGLKLVTATRDLAEKHYAVHKGKPFYESLLSVPDQRADGGAWCWRAARRSPPAGR